MVDRPLRRQIHLNRLSQEVGPLSLYMSTRRKATGASSSSTIISDLAGKRRKEYKNEKSLTRLMTDFSKIHPYTIKFEKAMRIIMTNLAKERKNHLEHYRSRSFTT
jgi:hypothetical protein